jgi:long-chain fatty acid transport protein
MVAGTMVAGTMLAPRPAHAGGLERPNGVSARGVGMGGAWAAWVDDATAVFFNPAALSYAAPEVSIGGELVLGPRSYTPLNPDGSAGAKQTSSTTQPLPSLGIIGRFWYDGHPSRFTLGLAVANTFGGKVAFPKTSAAALDTIEDAAIEVSAGTGVYISDKFSFGASVRLGLGLFAADSTMKPFDSTLSATGLGAAMAWGFIFRPSDDWRIAATWRSPLRISTTGTGTVVFPTGPTNEKVQFDQKWPQVAALSVGWRPTPQLKVSAQLDYTQWSIVDTLRISLPSAPNLDQVFPVAWTDSWTVRAGGEYRVSPVVQVRAGAYFDTNAIPDRTIERQYVDSAKVGVAGGASFHVAGWRIDGAVDVVLPNSRTVADNSSQVPPTWPTLKNIAPGTYDATLYTLNLAVAHGF